MIKQPSMKSLSGNKGFSAVELIAVATIIAVLALILIPILTSQVEKARETAVQDEMGQIAKVITLAFASTNHYYRLQDYDNLTTYNDPPQDPTIEVPVMEYVEAVPAALTAAQRMRLSKIWQGPGTIFHNSASMQEIFEGYPKACTRAQVGMGMTLEGPIVFNVTDMTAVAPPPPTLDEKRDLYPLDPWKNPYLFFAPGIFTPPGATDPSTITTPVIYSLGPDGLPGNKATPDAIDYWPVTGGVLGTGDDVVWKF